jgi:hypothetical protein
MVELAEMRPLHSPSEFSRLSADYSVSVVLIQPSKLPLLLRAAPLFPLSAKLLSLRASLDDERRVGLVLARLATNSGATHLLSAPRRRSATDQSSTLLGNKLILAAALKLLLTAHLANAVAPTHSFLRENKAEFALSATGSPHITAVRSTLTFLAGKFTGRLTVQTRAPA